MKVTDKDVSYVADLANLELTEEERTHMVRDLNSILGYIDRLNERAIPWKVYFHDIPQTWVLTHKRTLPNFARYSAGEVFSRPASIIVL